MKTTNLFKSIAITASFVLLGSSAFGQLGSPLVAPTGNDVTDSVTIGSTMPYKVTGDLNMHMLRAQGALTFSNFNWTVPTGGTLHDKTGAGAPAAVDSFVSVNWTALGAHTITATEVPQAAASQPAFACIANTQTLNVVVLNRPTIVWNGTSPAGGCGIAGTTVNIPITIAGTGQFDVYYKIDFTPLSGATSTPVDFTGAPFTIGSFQNGSQNVNLTYAVPAATYGKYVVTVSKVADRISKKSVVASTAADVPAATYVIYSYPTPVTGPITHIKNL